MIALTGDAWVALLLAGSHLVAGWAGHRKGVVTMARKRVTEARAAAEAAWAGRPPAELFRPVGSVQVEIGDHDTLRVSWCVMDRASRQMRREVLVLVPEVGASDGCWHDALVDAAQELRLDAHGQQALF